MGWLIKLTDWLREQMIAMFQAYLNLLQALFMIWLKQMCGVWLTLLDLLPVPDFLANYSMCTLLSQAGPTVGWVLNSFRIAEGLGLIGAAFAFRLSRKFLTLFQW